MARAKWAAGVAAFGAIVGLATLIPAERPMKSRAPIVWVKGEDRFADPTEAETKDGEIWHLAGPNLRDVDDLARPPYDPTLHVDPEPSIELEPAEAESVRKVASILDGSKFVPKDRLDQFSGYDSGPETITGWSATVRKVEPDPDGTGEVAAVSVYPRVDSREGGAVSILTGGYGYLERYRIVDGQAAFVGSSDPGREAGIRFGVIGL